MPLNHAMLFAEHLCDLRLDPLKHPRGQPHLSAASGLVRSGRWLYVVADDEHHLGVFDAVLAASPDKPVKMPPGDLMRLFEGDLSQEPGKRKKAKPDLESLALLPPLPACPHGALLALGSGSRPNRESGVLMALDASGAVSGHITHLDLSALYAPLNTRFTDLNLEGAFVANGELHLLQRGNRGDARNACIRFDWHAIAAWLAEPRGPVPDVKSVQWIDLGAIAGVPLGLTDGAALSGGAWVFSAVAEDTDDSFMDGACVGTVVGIMGPDGQVRQRQTLHGAPKIEGVVVEASGQALVLTMVTDPDDPAVASQLWRARLNPD